MSDALPVNFFTIVLNGQPFIRHHIEVFKRLKFNWRWHVIEGVADLKHDTAWSLTTGGKIVDTIHSNGLSNDGTSEYLDQISKEYPGKVLLYRKEAGAFWDGKLEMVNAPLQTIDEQCLLMQIDSDELWTVEQLETLHRMFIQNPDRHSAYFFCRYFVGHDLEITSRDTYGNNSGFEWLRAWRYIPGCQWQAHEPPRLCIPDRRGVWVDLTQLRRFSHAETEAQGLVFEHYAYVTESQLAFKEYYYGYPHAVQQWNSLQQTREFPALLRNHFAWVKDNAVVQRSAGKSQLALRALNGDWSFTPHTIPLDAPKEVFFIRTDLIGDAVLSTSILPALRDEYPYAKISVVCQDVVDPIYEHCPWINRVFSFNRKQAENDSSRLEGIADELSSYYPDVAINGAWSPDVLSHLITLSVNAKMTIAHHGNLSNISDADRTNIEKMYTQIIFFDNDYGTELSHYDDLIKGIDNSLSISEPHLWVEKSEIAAAHERFKQLHLDPASTLIFVPGASPGVRGREYHRFYEVFEEICQQYKLSLVALGTSKDRPIADNVFRSPYVKGVNLCGETSLREAIALISLCTVVVGVDTGLTHIAAALGIPNVLVYGGGHFGRFFPYAASTVAAALPLDCYNCNWHCKFQNVHCTEDIEPRTVIRAFEEAYRSKGTGPRIVQQSNISHQKNSVFPQISGLQIVLPQWRSCEDQHLAAHIQIIDTDQNDEQFDREQIKENPIKASFELLL